MDRAKKFRNWYLGSLGVVTASCLALAIIYRDVVSAAMSYSSEYEAAKKEGAIITEAEFAKLYEVKPEEDAAPYLAKILGKFPDDDRQAAKGQGNVPALGPNYEEAIRTYISYPFEERPTGPRRADLPDIEKVLSPVEQVMGDPSVFLTKPKCSSIGADSLRIMVNPKIYDLVLYTRALTARGLWLARRGEYQEANKRFEVAHRFCSYLDQDGEFLSFVVATALELQLFKALGHAAIYYLPSEPDFVKLQSLIDSFRLQTNNEKFFKVQSYIAMKTLSNLDQIFGDVDGYSNKYAFAARLPIVRRAWKTQFMRNLRELNTVGMECNYDPIILSGVSESLNFRQENDERVSLWMIDYFPDYSAAKRQFPARVAHRDLCRASLMALREWRKLGRWPAKLENLPRDPYDNQLIRYEVRKDKVVLWSVGPDRKDSGGKNRREDRSADDIWFYLPLDPAKVAKETSVRAKQSPPRPKNP